MGHRLRGGNRYGLRRGRFDRCHRRDRGQRSRCGSRRVGRLRGLCLQHARDRLCALCILNALRRRQRARRHGRGQTVQSTVFCRGQRREAALFRLGCSGPRGRCRGGGLQHGLPGLFFGRGVAHLKAALAAAGRCQRGANSAVDSVKDVTLFRKANFGFRRVDVDIDHVGRQLQHEHRARELALHHRALVGVFERRHHCAVFDVAAINKEMLRTAAGAAGTRRRDQAGHMVQLAAAVHGQQIAGKFTAQDRVDRTAQVAVAGGHILLLAVAQIAEADLRVGQRRVQDGLSHKRALAGVLFQKLHAGGRVVKQVTDRDGRADGARAGLHPTLLAAFDAVAAGVLVGLCAGQHLDAGNAGNGGKCLAAEAQGMDVPEILRRRDLAGGMADKRFIDIFRFYA